MITTPDPIDVLKYVVLYTREMLMFVADEAGNEDSDVAADVCQSLRRDLAVMLSAFVDSQEAAETYTDGSRVLTTLSSPGRTRINFHRPPGAPTAPLDQPA